MRNRDGLLLVSMVLSLAACGGGGGGAGNATPPTNGGPVPDTISGSAMFNAAPLSGVTITAFNNNTDPSTIFAIATTDANGNYSFTDLPTGCHCISNYSLVATKTGYAFNPFMANNPGGIRTSYTWDAPPQNWQVALGANATRAGFNGVFTNPNGGAGIMFNTIDFNSVTNNSVTGANFNAYNGSNPLVHIAASGQRSSYAVGDDAAANAGVAWPVIRYVDNQDGTVLDNLTGLVWLKNAGCFAPTIWASALADANSLASGSCGLSDGSTAGQWRLPNVVELESLVDASASNPVSGSSPFINVTNAIYWTSTAYYGGQEGTTNAWVIRFGDGSYINDSSSNVMATSNNAVWAVKGMSGTGSAAVTLQATGAYVPFGAGDDGTIEAGAALPSPRMVDNGNGTVTDTLTGLVWLKMANCFNDTWSNVLTDVNALATGQCGLTDGSTAGSWRVPNRKEMQSLADRAQNNLADYLDETFVSGLSGLSSQPNIFNSFVGFQFYWTSTTNAADTSEAWTVFSCDYGVYDIAKANAGYTLAVR